MTSRKRKPLKHYLSLNYPFVAHVGDDGEYYIEFPDLPGLFTGGKDIDHLSRMIPEGIEAWTEVEYDLGHQIPEPTVWSPDEYSGKFNVRLPRSLHRTLAEAAEREGASLNQYIVALLSRNDAQARIERRLDAIEERIGDRAARATRVADERGAYDAGQTGRKHVSTKAAARKTATKQHARGSRT